MNAVPDLAVDALNAHRPVAHVRIVPHVPPYAKPQPSGGGWLIACTCRVRSWHCAYWVTAAELGQRLVEHSREHARCGGS